MEGGGLLIYSSLFPSAAATFCRSLLASGVAESLVLIRIKSRVLRNKHSHSSGVARTSPIALEQGNGGITAPSDIALRRVAESITGLMSSNQGEPSQEKSDQEELGQEMFDHEKSGHE
ncbi:hypothetical protein DVH24_021045 [Malus domestica]|uniref:Uncharacterized protein n=1 Tax=Malus domestica TaxID=3750 RepID=A0A498JE67_MALDO|nr:hypothetical protein DVH24_021045 [Malus domestica]